MPVFELTPTETPSSDWEASIYNGVCRVVAEDGDRARTYAADKFRIGTVRTPAHEPIPTTPWTNPKLVTVKEIAGRHTEHKMGHVEVPTGDRSALFDDTWEGGDIRVTRDGEVRVARGGREGTPMLTEEGEPIVVETPAADAEISLDIRVTRDHAPAQNITQTTVKTALRNRAQLMFKASILHEALDHLIGPDGVAAHERNAPSVSELLGLDGSGEPELLQVLVELRDELQLFNRALETQKLEPGLLRQLAEAGVASVKAFGIAFGSAAGLGVGGMFVISIGQVLVDAGIMDWGRFMEFVKVARGSSG